jgi:hypothetical protein
MADAALIAIDRPCESQVPPLLSMLKVRFGYE